jgi:hypothetical protein
MVIGGYLSRSSRSAQLQDSSVYSCNELYSDFSIDQFHVLSRTLHPVLAAEKVYQTKGIFYQPLMTKRLKNVVQIFQKNSKEYWK